MLTTPETTRDIGPSTIGPLTIDYRDKTIAAYAICAALATDGLFVVNRR